MSSLKILQYGQVSPFGELSFCRLHGLQESSQNQIESCPSIWNSWRFFPKHLFSNYHDVGLNMGASRNQCQASMCFGEAATMGPGSATVLV